MRAHAATFSSLGCLNKNRIQLKRMAGAADDDSVSSHPNFHTHQRLTTPWSARVCHEYFEERPWPLVLDFYSLVVAGDLSLYDLRFQKSSCEGCMSTRRANFLSIPKSHENVVKICSEKERGGKWERRTFRILLSYYGASFVGWQRQLGLSTVQGVVEKALGRFIDGKRAKVLLEQGKDVEANISVAGRTDKGVHAIGQVCSFYTWMQDAKAWEIEAAINVIIPQKLRAFQVDEVCRSFHPNFSARWRRYIYLLPLLDQETLDYSAKYNGAVMKEGRTLQPEAVAFEHVNACKSNDKNGFIEVKKNSIDTPLPSKLEWTTHDAEMDVKRVNRMLQKLEGHNLSYAVFARDTQAARSRGSATMCTIYHARANVAELPALKQNSTKTAHVLCVEIVADRFLRKMVRVLVATAIREAVTGAPDNALLVMTESTCRRSSAPPAPASGLCLAEVGYEDIQQAHFMMP